MMMIDIESHPLLKKCVAVAVAIEECGASKELTDATILCSELLVELDKHLKLNNHLRYRGRMGLL